MEKNAICWKCGKPATEYPTKSIAEHYCDRPFYSYRAYCPECAERFNQSRREQKKQYIILKARLMFERAIRLLEHQDIHIYDYQEAIGVVEKFVEKYPDKMQSADEVVAAIILIKKGMKIRAQAKIGRYTVDFLIPELKVVLEIDGALHADKLYYDNERDKTLRADLGDDWEVVRIKTEYIEQNAKQLVKAIKQVREQKQLLRAQSGGELPDWYSKRQKKPKKQNYGDELLLEA